MTLLLAPVCAFAQGRGGGPPPTAKAAAPIDLTGYWVAVVTDRLALSDDGACQGRLSERAREPEARRIADAWDPAKDEAAGEQCRATARPTSSQVPGRLHITWQDDNTLKVETDNGTQTRLFHFNGPAPQGEASWQGDSTATWEFAGGRAPRPGTPAHGGDLSVVTRNMKAGYIQKNGVPYSASALLTEHFDVVHEPDGKTLLLATEMLEDPTYLARRFQRSTHFRKQDDATGWDPEPCSAK